MHKPAIGNRIGRRLPVKHALFTWLVEHVADVLNRFAAGADGKTAPQRLNGKSCGQYVLEFAPACIRVCGKVEGSLMTERWFRGMWLGKRLGTEEHLVMKQGGIVVRARAVREEEKTMTMADHDTLTGRPHDPFGTLHAGGARDTGRRVDLGGGGVQPGPEDRAAPKQVMTTRDIIARYGVTSGCKKCRGVVIGDRAHQHVHHREGRRTRAGDLMRNGEAYKGQVMKAEHRRIERLAEILGRRVKAQVRQARQDEEVTKKRKLAVHQANAETALTPEGVRHQVM